MAFNRCFDNYNKTIVSSSDYSTAQRQMTIYSELAKNSQSGNANPVKSNGSTYNDNFGVLTGTGGGCLGYAKDYKLLLDVTKGQYLVNSETTTATSSSAIPYDVLTGNLLVVDYASNGVDVVVDTSYNAGNANEIIFPQTISAQAADLSFNNSYPGVIVDPSYLIFYDECMQGFNSNKNPWLRLSSIGFQDTNFFQQAVKANPYNNFIYPQPLVFNTCLENMSLRATFNFTGGVQTYNKPAGVCIIKIEAIGAGGGGGAQTDDDGGDGGIVSSYFDVPCNQTSFEIYVGSGGNYNNIGGTNPIGASANGGSVGNVGTAQSGSGGALTSVKLNNQIIIIAGGGGGAGDGSGGGIVAPGFGGYGGGLGNANGGDGADSNTGSGAASGKGGNANGTGGAAGIGAGATNGASSTGSNLGTGGTGSGSSGGGGGSGYGGGGGGGTYSGGGGGSSYSIGFNTIYTIALSSGPGKGGSPQNSGSNGQVKIYY